MRAAAWAGAYLLLIAAPLAILLIRPMPPGREFWWDFSMALGFGGLALIGVQFALTARFKRVSAPFGIDILYFFHRYLAIIAATLAAAHFVILWLRYEEALGPLDPRLARWELTAGRVALLLFVLTVATSEARKLLRFEYGWWRFAHVVMATVGFAAAVLHIIGVGYYTAEPVMRLLWLSVALLWVLLVCWVRIVKPWTQARKPYRVVEVRAERGDSWTLALEPDGHAGLRRFMPGQFAWLTLGNSPFGLREHPFSLASAPEALPRVEFGIKALGDFTGTIPHAKPGDVAYLDAPYGVFSIDRRPGTRGFAGIVGGIGVTPLMSMLRSLAERGDRRPVWLFNGNVDWEDVIYREELEGLRERLDLTLVHILTEPPEGWSGETGVVTRELLQRHLPQGSLTELHYFLCGPAPMTKAAAAALLELGVPAAQVQTEIFDLV